MGCHCEIKVLSPFKFEINYDHLSKLNICLFTEGGICTVQAVVEAGGGGFMLFWSQLRDYQINCLWRQILLKVYCVHIANFVVKLTNIDRLVMSENENCKESLIQHLWLNFLRYQSLSTLSLYLSIVSHKRK